VERNAAQLEAALEGCNTDPQSRRFLQIFAQQHPAEFFEAATARIDLRTGLPGERFLAGLLLRQQYFFEILTDPARLSLRTATRIFRNLLTFDATLDFRLARMLPGRGDSSTGKILQGASAVRAIDILDRTSQGQKVLSLVGHLPNHADPALSAKASLFVGRRLDSPAWVAKQMVHEDPRVRANVMESSWGRKSKDTVRLMADCLEDANNRVAGNALVGLHLAGSPDVVERALAMSRSDDPALRSTVAWAMGKIGDPAFLPRLTELMKDSAASVRSTTVRSLVEIGRAESRKAAEKKAAAQAEEAARRRAEEAANRLKTKDPESEEYPEVTFALRLDGSSFAAGKG
jgi:hypothetical protein